MREMITYLIELNIAITIFFGAYLLIFRKDANFRTRRVFLLTAMTASLVIPFLRFDLAAPAGNLNTALIILPEVILRENAVSQASATIKFPEILMILYIIVGLFFAGKLTLGLTRILIHAMRSKKTFLYGTRVLINKELHASSFFNLIFIDPEQTSESDLAHIMEHETFHARLFHSIDRMIAEVMLIISWFNPVVWLLRKAIVVNHEYQADNGVIEHGTDQVSYQLTILNQYIGSASISNQFSSQIKNRINMLNKNYKKGSSWKGLMLFPVSIALLFFMACGNEEPIDSQAEEELTAEKAQNPPEEEVFFIVEEMPQWPDSDEDLTMAMRKFIAKNVKYPDIAKEKNVEGKVFVTFMVTRTGDVIVPDPAILPPPQQLKDGSMDEVVVVSYKTFDPDQETPDQDAIQALKDEGVRVVELMPDLVPGKQRGVNVNVLFTMPISFKLQ